MISQENLRGVVKGSSFYMVTDFNLHEKTVKMNDLLKNNFLENKSVILDPRPQVLVE